ncbi:MAG: metallophosphoesterase [Candidatus Nealsonbacteria bacterium]
MKLNKTDIKISSAFSKLDGTRILHISDLHLAGRNKRMERYFEKLGKIKSDFVMVTGDLIDNDDGIEWCLKYLKKLSPRFGIWACLGNHDKFGLSILHTLFFHLMGTLKENNFELLGRRLKESGIQILINEKKTINVNSVPLTIIGVDAPFGLDRCKNKNMFSKKITPLRELFSNIPPKNYVVLLNHVPDLLKELGDVKINLALCGHTHGGQIRLPFIGPLVAFSSFQRAYNKGLYNYNGYYLHVSGGLGASKTTSIRLFCPPEATILTLRS